MEPVNDEGVVAEIRERFTVYEEALMSNDLATLHDCFWDDPRTTRYGIADRQIGIAELDAFRDASPAPAFTRQLFNLRITTFGRDFATSLVEFVRSDGTDRGFQTQCWVRTPAGWKIVNAHVSQVPFPSSPDDVAV